MKARLEGAILIVTLDDGTTWTIHAPTGKGMFASPIRSWNGDEPLLAHLEGEHSNPVVVVRDSSGGKWRLKGPASIPDASNWRGL